MNYNWWPTPDGQWRALGHNPTANRRFVSLGKVPDIPESEWREFDYRDDPGFKVKVKDQGQYGACNGHAAATSLEIARYIAGLPHVDLSAWMIYADLCQGIDRGSNIQDALTLLKSMGTCRDALVPHGTINPQMLSPESERDRSNYIIEIGYEITCFREMCCAVQARQVLNHSIPVNGNYNTLDKYDRPQNHAGADNHAICSGVYMRKLPTNEWVIGSPGSWSTRWGKNGYCSIGERNVQGRFFSCYSVVATVTDPQNQPPAVR